MRFWMDTLFLFASPAVDGGYKEIVELLVRKGAEVNRTHTASCWTCLHQAVYKVIKGAKMHLDRVSLQLRYSRVCVIEGSHPNCAHLGESVQPGGSR